MAQRNVIINGVVVPMYRKEEGDTHSPMKIALNLLRVDPSASFGGAPEADAIAAIDALADAGVKWLPVVEAEAREAGVVWEELSA